jgi:hypothetical protein
MRFINNRKKLFIKRTDILQHGHDINILLILWLTTIKVPMGIQNYSFCKLGHVLAPIKSDIDLASSQT